MMKVEENKNEGLQRAFTITIPSDDIENALLTRLQEIGKKAKVQGFRPGKVPLALIRQRFGADARAEVIDKIVSESTEKALTERQLRLAMQPKVDLIEAGEGKDLAFKLDVEILPDVKPMDFTKLSLTRPMADVDDATIEEAITRLSKTLREPEPVAEKRAAKKGDVVVIDFDGKVDGTAYPGMKAEDHKLELGSKSFVGTFEDQLVGLKAGAEKDVTVTFPEDYHAKHLAGKEAVFAVKVKELRQPKPVTMDDELAKEIGFPSFEAMRKQISEDIGADYAKVSRVVLKRALMDALSDKHNFEIPPGMVEAEFGGIWRQVLKDKAEGKLPADEAKKKEADLEKDYRKIAERRIRLGLLLAEVAQSNKIEVTQDELRNAMIAEARRFPGQEKAVFDYFMKTEGAIERLRAPILEEKVVDFILAQAKIADKKMSADDLMKLPEADEE
jgi:trigger factor